MRRKLETTEELQFFYQDRDITDVVHKAVHRSSVMDEETFLRTQKAVQKVLSGGSITGSAKEFSVNSTTVSRYHRKILNALGEASSEQDSSPTKISAEEKNPVVTFADTVQFDVGVKKRSRKSASRGMSLPPPASNSENTSSIEQTSVKRRKIAFKQTDEQEEAIENLHEDDDSDVLHIIKKTANIVSEERRTLVINNVHQIVTSTDISFLSSLHPFEKDEAMAVLAWIKPILASKFNITYL